MTSNTFKIKGISKGELYVERKQRCLQQTLHAWTSTASKTMQICDADTLQKQNQDVYLGVKNIFGVVQNQSFCVFYVLTEKSQTVHDMNQPMTILEIIPERKEFHLQGNCYFRSTFLLQLSVNDKRLCWEIYFNKSSFLCRLLTARKK